MRAPIHSNLAVAAAAPIVFMSPIRLQCLAAILLYYWHLANALSAYSMNTIALRLIACLPWLPSQGQPYCRQTSDRFYNYLLIEYTHAE